MEPTFGERLRALRKSTGKRQQHMADEINARYPDARMSQTTVSALEQRASAPREDVLTFLAEYFGVSPGYFYELTEDREAQIDFARAYVRAIANRTFTPAPGSSNDVEDSRFPAESHNMQFWQTPFGLDEYLED